MQRVVIYPKDVVILTGKSEKYGRRLLNRIKKCNSKEENHFITIQEFCKFTGIPIDIVEKSLKN